MTLEEIARRVTEREVEIARHFSADFSPDSAPERMAELQAEGANLMFEIERLRRTWIGELSALKRQAQLSQTLACANYSRARRPALVDLAG